VYPSACTNSPTNGCSASAAPTEPHHPIPPLPPPSLTSG
jgi:hypothetical protein